MAKMVNPELEVVRFENEDVIADSRGQISTNGIDWYVNGNKTSPAQIDQYYKLYDNNGNPTSASEWSGGGTWTWRNENNYDWNDNGSGS